MNSAPATLRIPAIPVQVTPISTPEMFQNEPYPWAMHTPEASPRCWEKGGCFAPQAPVQPVLSQKLMQSMCAPYFEQMCHEIQSGVSAQQLSGNTMVSRELLRQMCEPFFEKMTSALQQALQQQMQQETHWAQVTCQPAGNTGFHYQTPFFRFDEESTEASESCAFASLFSVTSSEVDHLDVAEEKSEGSELASDVDRSPMVCRHWKSKGWCRLESSCKFLHPEHKRGVCAPADGAAALRRKKRGGKNRSARAQQEQLGNEGQKAA